MLKPAHPGPVARDLKTPISFRSCITPSPPPNLNFTRTLLTLSAYERRSDISLSPDRKEVTYPLRKGRCSVTNASPTSSTHRDVPIRPPHHSLPPPSRLPRLLDPATIDSVPDGTVQLRKGRRRPDHRRAFSHTHDKRIPKLEYDLPADFSERVRSKPSPLC
jgi:hypothetical protein